MDPTTTPTTCSTDKKVAEPKKLANNFTTDECWVETEKRAGWREAARALAAATKLEEERHKANECIMVVRAEANDEMLRIPPGHASSLAFQDTLRELMIKKEETIAEREERRRREKETTTKSFVDLQMRALEVKDALAKSMFVETEAKARLMDVDANSVVLEVEAKIMAGENQVMLTDLGTIFDPVQRAWI
ncbi:hypothetical protein QYE76_000627 [Lolium multiflorum]|uniref:Uncharacterized protein n=1 Tax=Lolium multiflorum TaxID=4521 RepID=A0AAD8VWK1_LOLMU|nr:hypothetical protein QYE76_000627 [Lolium multiflorum]